MSNACYMRPCKLHTPRGHVFCIHHWKMVPVGIQLEIYAAGKAKSASTMVASWDKGRAAIQKATT